MMRRLIAGLCLVVGTALFATAALAAESAQVDEIFHAKVEFFRAGTLIGGEELSGAGTMASEIAVPEEGPLSTYRFRSLVQARSHLATPREGDAPSLYAGSQAFTAALRLAQHMTVNDVDLAVYHPGADTCRATVWWTYYSVVEGSLTLDEEQPVTREARTAQIKLKTPETEFFDDGTTEQYRHIEQLIRAPELIPGDEATAADPEADPPVTPLDDIRIQGVTEYQSSDLPYPYRPDTRPIALYGDRIVRYDLGVLEDRTLYIVTLAFRKDGEELLRNDVNVLDVPLPALFSSIYWHDLESLQPGWPDEDRPGPTVQLNYLVRLRSQQTGELLCPGRCLEELPRELADALHYFTFGGLRFEVYHPGADSVEVCVSTQLIPGHEVSQYPGELVPMLRSLPPGPVEDLGCTVVELANPLLDAIELPGGVREDELGVATSATTLTVVPVSQED